ncbi:mechanosensitive ion channel family protein [Cytobacillus gottheilii]|uniref:mechanosensitive ion channel family protein n=1 Tax=Cytobacillus gottheilii TaxID=859144 RepID=UPI0024952DF5|nr:mechanosensitive ion channel family protein [Cytobacillus gottheilii]
MNGLDSLILEIKEHLFNEALWWKIGEGALRILLIIIITRFIIKSGKILIHKLFTVRTRSAIRITERREATLMKLLENVLTYVTSFIALMMILQALTINVGALLAGAGIVGLAVGFGAQNLVKDIITGFFIIFEDQFSVGDYVRIDQFEGTVEEIGLRTTKIKNWTGELHILPNGSIIQVTNFSLNNSVAFVDVSLTYDADFTKAEEVLQELFLTLPEKYSDMVKPPEILGIQTMAGADVAIRVTSETLPMRHFYIARILRKEIKFCLEQNGFDVPFPRMVTYSREPEINSGKMNMGG